MNFQVSGSPSILLSCTQFMLQFSSQRGLTFGYWLKVMGQISDVLRYHPSFFIIITQKQLIHVLQASAQSLSNFFSVIVMVWLRSIYRHICLIVIFLYIPSLIVHTPALHPLRVFENTA